VSAIPGDLLLFSCLAAFTLAGAGRAGLRRRASTVTGGSGLVPGSTEGVAGVVCGSGVSDAGGVVVCGVASLMPPQQTHSVIASAASA
jgi:hypothetical protein